MGNSFPDNGIVRHSIKWSTLWYGHTYPCFIIQYASQSHYIWTTNFLMFIPIYSKLSSTGTPTYVAAVNDISEFKSPWIFPVFPLFWGTPTHLNGRDLLPEFFYIQSIFCKENSWWFLLCISQKHQVCFKIWLCG